MLKDILGSVASLAYLAAFLRAGLSLARMLLPEDTREERLVLGVSMGLVLLMWLPALSSFVLGFTLVPQFIALAAAMGVEAFAWKRAKRTPLDRENAPADRRFLYLTLPLLALFAAMLYTHTLLPDSSGALWSGQSTQGDMCMHLGIISSISRQGFFPPEYSIMSGVPMSYPFLCDSVSSTFYTLGAPLRVAYMLPMLPAFFAVAGGLYIFFRGWFKRGDKALLAGLLFFVGGGFGFAYFMNGSAADPYNFTRIFTAFYETPTSLGSENMRWANVLTDMLLPQRATLFGWAVLFPCLHLLRRSAFDGKNDFALLGVMAGALPLVHTHSFLALGLVSIVWLCRAVLREERIRPFILYGLIAMALALPQLLLFTFRQAGGFLAFNFNWSNEGDPFIWFYIKNMGLIFLLLPVALCAADKRGRETWCGVLLLWIVAELIQFQPNPYDNNKLLFVWFAFNCGIVASLLVDAYEKLSGLGGRRLLAGIVLCAMLLSGTLSIGRECVSRYQLFGADSVEAASFIEKNIPADAVFLTADDHTNTVAALTGRSIVCGSASYLYYHGYDTTERMEDVRRMFTERKTSSALYEKYGVDYIYLGYCEINNYALSHIDFADLEVAFANGGVTIYRYAPSK